MENQNGTQGSAPAMSGDKKSGNTDNPVLKNRKQKVGNGYGISVNISDNFTTTHGYREQFIG